MGTCPARRRIGRRDELRCHFSRGAEGCVVQHGYVFVDRAAGHVLRQALRSLNATLPVGVGLDQAGVDREAVAAHEPLRHAAAHHLLEEMAQQIAVAEAAMAVLREGGMLGDIALQAEPAEPPVGQI